MRTVALFGALAAAVGVGVAPAAPSSPPIPTVPCDEIILRTSRQAGGYRVVLGVVSVPPAYLEQVVDTHSRPWRYWRKAGLVIRSDIRTPVDVRVPPAWRTRAAITWGYPQIGVVPELRIAPCASWGPKKWNAYSGGFHLRSPSACVPLLFRVGHRTATVRFGVGRRC